MRLWTRDLLTWGRNLGLMAFLYVLLSGCSSPTETYRRDIFLPTPRKVNGSQPVAFYRVIFDVESGGKVGGHYDGLLKVLQMNYYWDLGTFAGSEQYKLAATEELRNYGYTVLGAESVLFGEDKSQKARYQLGGTIKDIRFNTYARLAGGFSEAEIAVEWQMRDGLRREIVFKSTTAGCGKQSGTGVGVVLIAFREAFRQLLANNEFAGLLTSKKGGTTSSPLFHDSLIIKMPHTDEKILLPGNMDKVMQGVVLIRVGGTHASGFLISENGYILTVAHAVSGVKEVAVQLKSGLELSGEVARLDEAQDIALIKIAGKGYYCLSLEVALLPAVGTELYVFCFNHSGTKRVQVKQRSPAFPMAACAA